MSQLKVVIETPDILHWIAVDEENAATVVVALAEALRHTLLQEGPDGFLYIEEDGQPAVIRADQVLAIFIADEEDDL